VADTPRKTSTTICACLLIIQRHVDGDEGSDTYLRKSHMGNTVRQQNCT